MWAVLLEGLVQLLDGLGSGQVVGDGAGEGGVFGRALRLGPGRTLCAGCAGSAGGAGNAGNAGNAGGVGVGGFRRGAVVIMIG